MISRIWHGWTTPANADAYETLLRSEIFQGIQSRQIESFKGIHLLRRSLAMKSSSLRARIVNLFDWALLGDPVTASDHSPQGG